MKNLIISALLFAASIVSVSVFAANDAGVDLATNTHLVIYRSDNSAANTATYYRIWVDGKHIGKLKRDTVMNLQLAAGEHIITANDREHTQFVVVTSEHGITYVQADIDKRRRLSLTSSEPSAQIVNQLAQQ